MPMLRRHLLFGLTAAVASGPGALVQAAAATSATADDPTTLRPPPLLLARVDTGALDPAQCLVSEKFDGVRAYWDGGRLRHRSGRLVAAPTWFTERLPRQPLDGELWMGRGRFDELSAAVRAARPDDEDWRRLRYLVFELPDAPGTFAERARAIEQVVETTAWRQLEAVEQSRVADRVLLLRRLEETVAAGGEGLMLHLASARYVVGRSEVLGKLKPHLDAEALVVGVHAGKGKYRGDAGALEVETPEGRRFRLGAGLPDGVRRDPPRVGSTVTYRYQALTPNGVPRFARLLRVHEAF